MQKFNYHTHTRRCGHADFRMDDEDYVKEFIKKGFKKIAFTDHCPEKDRIDTRSNMRMDYIEIDEYLDSINTLKEKYKNEIEIETGFEVEYLPGQETNLFELKEKVDKIVLGQHFIYKEDNKSLKHLWREDYTDEDLLTYANYVINAIKLGIPDIIVHPDIFMLGRNNFGNIEEKITRMICEEAAKNNIILEINLSQPFNKVRDSEYKVSYPQKKFWEIVSEYDINVLYGIDAHYKEQIINYEKSIEIANEIIGKDVIQKLNFIEVEKNLKR